MRINTRLHHDVVIIEPKERITVETEAQFTEVVRTLLKAGPRRLVLSLVDVPYIDSMGLGAIVQAYTSARQRGGDIRLLHVKHWNRQLLAITSYSRCSKSATRRTEAGAALIGIVKNRSSPG